MGTGCFSTVIFIVGGNKKMEVGTEVVVNERVFGDTLRETFIGEAGIVIEICKFEHADILYAVILHNRKSLGKVYFFKEELSMMNGSADEEYDNGVSTDTIISELLGGAL